MNRVSVFSMHINLASVLAKSRVDEPPQHLYGLSVAALDWAARRRVKNVQWKKHTFSLCQINPQGYL